MKGNCQMEETLMDISRICNRMDELQREIESMEICLERLEERLAYSLEHCLCGAGLLPIRVSVYEELVEKG